jgi:hypothetical protein
MPDLEFLCPPVPAIEREPLEIERKRLVGHHGERV